MFIPNWVNIYGSSSFRVSDEIINVEDGNLYKQTINIAKSGLRALHQPSQPCDNGENQPDTSSCIANYINNQLGCDMNIYGNMMNKMKVCNSSVHYDEWRNISAMLEKAETNFVNKLTGCLPSCHRNEYVLTGKELKKNKVFSFWSVETRLQLDFIILDSSYKEEEQYVIYDFNSFIGDVGGFLGLLLGYSALSIYDALDSLLKRFK